MNGLRTVLLSGCLLIFACVEGAPLYSQTDGATSESARLCEKLHRELWRRPLRLDDLRTLLEEGANPNCVQNGNSPLALAVSAGHPEVVRLLIERGADVDDRDALGRTPLIALFKTRAPDTAIVRLLLEAGSDARAHDSSGNTVLHFARYPRWIDAARLVIDAGADVNATNILGDTPLCNVLPADSISAELVELFVRAGARPCPYDSNGNPARLVTVDLDSTSWTGVRLPCDLGDALGSLDAMLHRRHKAHIGISPEAALVSMHMDLGLWLRNNWGLWGDGPLACWFISIGVRHPDHMSSIILRVFRRDLRGEPWRLAEEIDRALASEQETARRWRE